MWVVRWRRRLGPATGRATGGVDWMDAMDESSLGGLVGPAAGGAGLVGILNWVMRAFK